MLIFFLSDYANHVLAMLLQIINTAKSAKVVQQRYVYGLNPSTKRTTILYIWKDMIQYF